MAKEPTNKQLYDLVSKKFDVVDSRFGLFATQLENIQDDIRVMQKVQKEHTERLDEIQSTLDAVSRAVDKDAVTLIAHGRRLARLERGRV